MKKTSLRRSERLNRSITPETPINDDEAERRAGREKVLHNESLFSVYSESLQKDNKGLKNCLKMFAEMKINKHHKSTRNFQMAGSTLEASSKIHGLRVDSVHTDVNIATGLTRLKNKPQNVNGAGENDGSGGGDDTNEGCKGLQREHTVINDMRPTSSINLEYSYRPLDNIGPTPAHTTSGRATISGPIPMRPGGGRRTLNKKMEPVQFVDDFDDSMFVEINSEEAQKIRQVNTSKWDPKKLKLPTNHNVDPLMFHRYQYAPTNWNNLADSDVNNDAGDKVLNKTTYPKNQDNVSIDGGGDDHFGDIADNNDFDDGINNDEVAVNNENDQTGLNTQDNLAANETVQEIGTEFTGAPEKVQKIDILIIK